ncbi:ABC transporter substrate-binding protein [Paenibacillus apiarius]|uniref:ABC transporter substrate-binding protein n=1 Tax=Paenibacillus apiarius TaxID=46240 RepID=UPI00300D7818
MKIKTTWIILMVAVAATAGCAQQSSKPDSSEAKVITVASSTDSGISRLDAASYEGMMQAYPIIYDSLVEYGAKGEIQPALAESWEISPDGKAYTFHLRKDVLFSDGTPFNAEAVKFSVQRWANKPEHDWLLTSKNMKSVEVLDEFTVKLTFTQHNDLTLTELSYPRPFRIMSPTSVEPAGDPEGKFVKAIGTAAWVLDEYKQDVQTMLKPNPNYWGKKSGMDKLTFKVVPDAHTRVLAAQNGTIDIAGGEVSKIPLESLPLLKNGEKTKLVAQKGTASYFLVVNGENAALADKKVRQALNYAVDKQSIAHHLFDGAGSPASGILPATNAYVSEGGNQGYPYNPEMAKQLLSEAGWTDANRDGTVEKEGKSLILSLVLQTEEFPEWKPLAEAVQDQLSKVGIHAEIKVLEQASYYDALWKNKDYDLLIYRSYADAFNPLSFLRALFYQTNEIPAVAFGTDRLSALIDRAAAALTNEERFQTYDEIFRLMKEEAMSVPLFYPDDLFVVNNRISDVQLGATTFKPMAWEKLRLAE